MTTITPYNDNQQQEGITKNKGKNSKFTPTSFNAYI